MSGVAAAGWRGGWWTEAALGSVWLAVIGVHSSRSPAVMADRMTLLAFSLPSIACVSVCLFVCVFNGCVYVPVGGGGGSQLVTEMLTTSIGPV